MFSVNESQQLPPQHPFLSEQKLLWTVWIVRILTFQYLRVVIIPTKIHFYCSRIDWSKCRFCLELTWHVATTKVSYFNELNMFVTELSMISSKESNDLRHREISPKKNLICGCNSDHKNDHTQKPHNKTLSHKNKCYRSYWDDHISLLLYETIKWAMGRKIL